MTLTDPQRTEPVAELPPSVVTLETVAANVRHLMNASGGRPCTALQKAQERLQEAAREEAQALARRLEAAGLVLTVEQVPLQPLAMGHYRTVVSVRLAIVKPKAPAVPQ